MLTNWQKAKTPGLTKETFTAIRQTTNALVHLSIELIDGYNF